VSALIAGLVPAVDLGGLLELVWIAPLASVLVTVSFSSCVLGATRSTDARRAGRQGKGVAWMALALLSGLAVLAEVVAGIVVILYG
jgi:hypothetical protein